jgi:hypothetical protein
LREPQSAKEFVLGNSKLHINPRPSFCAALDLK